MKTGVYPLHFCWIQEKIYGYYGMPYFRQSKSKRSVIQAIIPSLKMILYRHIGFKLAMFTDKNMRRECIYSLKRFLEPYDELNDEMLHDVLKEYRNIFGLFLLYECLKYLKVIEKKHYPNILYYNEILRKKLS